MASYLEVANAPLVFLIVLIPVVLVLSQAVVYIRLAAKRINELGMEKNTVRKVIINSAIFSIVPSLPIVITLAALMAVLGRYVPWLRLSVIGSAMYESMCADMTIKSFGYTGLGDSSISAEVFVSVVWVMSTVALAWPLCNVIGLRFYDRRLKRLQKTSGFIKPATGAMFIGLMTYYSVPRFFNFAAPTCIIVSVVAGGSAVLLDFLAKKTGIHILSDFAFPLAMVLGMVSAVIAG
ncbi:MAG: DUF5058 family protein [Treponema sp.]|jgi:hypothetical protein|nr:DUF5058 family protein [Treponema sp.]